MSKHYVLQMEELSTPKFDFMNCKCTWELQTYFDKVVAVARDEIKHS